MFQFDKDAKRGEAPGSQRRRTSQRFCFGFLVFGFWVGVKGVAGRNI